MVVGRSNVVAVTALVVALTAGACGANEGSPSGTPAAPAETADPGVEPVLAAFEQVHASTIELSELGVTEHLGILFSSQQVSMLPGADIDGSTRSTGQEFAERMGPEGFVVPLPDGVVDTASTAEVHGGSEPTLVTYQVVTDARPSEIEHLYEERAVDEGWRVARDAVPPEDVGTEATWALARGETSVLVLAERSEEFGVTVLRVLIVQR